MLYQRGIRFLYSRISRIFFKLFFKRYGKNSSIIFPLNLQGMKNISIGNNVYIAYKTYLSSMSLTGNKKPILEIGDGTSIGNFNHIFATEKVVIGRKVLTADKVYISDNLHSYENISIPIIDQKIKQISHVEIGDGSWIGENVCIIGVKIGKNCVIGANSVVTKNIPDYCVAAGSPAKIIKKFNSSINKWERID
tara:strand:+ start:15606 stop:16187 length:582 start_codon:yes stop_codon:yes gene_type:complete